MIKLASPTDALTPSELNRRVRVLLESHFDFVWVDGEVSNFARPSSGHWYFTLKDDAAQVRCAMFRNTNQRLRFTPANGDQVRLRARVSLYEGRGEFQLIGEFMEPAGAGALQARFEALRDRLRLEGLFDQERKQPLPASVSHLAVITSPTGAALQDILQVLARRNPAIRVSVLPVAVQGEAAAGELCAAVERANRLALTRDDCDFDAIILARGGGSLEDLWAFNDEALARAIVASALPIVAGVGHEVDVTIADFAADVRAPTPSAAAEVLSEDRQQMLDRLRKTQRQLALAMQQRLHQWQLRVDNLRLRLRHPGDRLREQAQRLDELEARLHRTMNERINLARLKQERQFERLHNQSPQRKIDALRDALQRAENQLVSLMQQQLMRQGQQLERRSHLLQSLNPLAILRRGYSILSDENGLIVRSAEQVSPAQRLHARLAEGHLTLLVEPAEGPSAAMRDSHKPAANKRATSKRKTD